VPAAREVRVERQGTVDERHHRADVLAEIGQGEGGVRQHAGIVAGPFQGAPGKISALAAMAMPNPASSQQSPPTSEKAKEIEAMVVKAAALVDKEGRVALGEFRKRDSEWWSGNTYLFAYDMDLNVLLNPAFPKREGTNAHGEKDANGVFFHDEFVKMVRSKGAGWVAYMFPKPGQTQPSQKWSYVKAIKMDGTAGLIGAGFYPE
jgi:cytochrome c